MKWKYLIEFCHWALVKKFEFLDIIFLVSIPQDARLLSSQRGSIRTRNTYEVSGNQDEKDHEPPFPNKQLAKEEMSKI